MSRANPLTTHNNAGIAATTTVKTKKDLVVNSFETAERAFFELSEGSFRWEVNLASNVRLRRQPGYFAIVLYDTEIVRYYPDGTFSVDSGGFNTPTTANRVTQFTPDGWRGFNEKKQLGIWKPPHENKIEIHPATHNERITP